MIEQKYFISIILDKRRRKANNKFPVRLRVFTPYPVRKQKLFATTFEFTEKDFASIWETTKPRTEFKATRLKLQALESRANDAASQLKIFDFEDFEQLIYGKSKVSKDLNFYFDKAIKTNQKANRIGTASNYELALKSLLTFSQAESLEFSQITVSFLEQYERFCIEEKNYSIATVGIYLRPLRAVYNSAISDKVINAESYPFGRKKYEIKAPSKSKKALSIEQMKILFEGTPQTPEQEKAKAFWFFSYLCNGMNIKDIIQLKYKDLDGDKFSFQRAKTARTSKQQNSITVYLIDYSMDVIHRYGNTTKSPESYIFPILEQHLPPAEQFKRKANFTRFINQHFLKYAKNLGITAQISTYWARHSFSTIAINKGARMEQIGEALGHTDIKTTMAYFAGFDNEAKRDISKKLLEF